MYEIINMQAQACWFYKSFDRYTSTDIVWDGAHIEIL